MKRFFLIVLITCLCVSVAFAQQEHKKQLWNNGEIDYIPSGSMIKLETIVSGDIPASTYYSLDFDELFEYKDPILMENEGRHWIFYGPVDILGQFGEAEGYTFIVDATAPELQYGLKGKYYVDENGSYYLTKDTDIYINAEDSLSGVDSLYISVAGSGFEALETPGIFKIGDIEDGKLTVDAYAVDKVGNASEIIKVGSAETFDLYVDNSAPEVEIEISTEPVEINEKSYVKPDTFCTITASDSLSGVKDIFYSCDGAEYITYEQEFNLTRKAGDHMITVFAEDFAGNSSEIIEFPFSVADSRPSSVLNLDIEE